jgi:hypothetical protein
LTVRSFSDTRVLTCQKARRSRRWLTFPPASGYGRGSDERTRLPKGTRSWANEETSVCEPRICMRGRAHRPRSLADLSQGPVARQGTWQPTQNPSLFMAGSIRKSRRPPPWMSVCNVSVALIMRTPPSCQAHGPGMRRKRSHMLIIVMRHRFFLPRTSRLCKPTNDQ